MQETRMTIGGRAVQSANSFEVLNPATGHVIGTAPNGSRADLDAAVAAAHKAFSTAYSGDRDQGFRRIVIADSERS